MTGRLEDKLDPFTVRQTAKGWEVLFVVEGEVPPSPYVLCESKEDAVAVANFNVFHHMYQYPFVYADDPPPNVEDVEKTLEALDKYGRSGVGLRDLKRFAEKLRQKAGN